MYALLATVWFLSTVCANFLFVTALLLMHHSALCVLCSFYLLSIAMCILFHLGAH